MAKLILALSFVATLFAKTEIVFWHAFEGFLKDTFSEIVDDFNNSSDVYRVHLQQKGNYTEVFNRGVEAFNHGNPPHILQVYEVATQTMRLNPAMYTPVDQLMVQNVKRYDPAIYIDAVREFYSYNGEMLSLPWNASTGVMLYNKEAFSNAGLDPESPPQTWDELVHCSKKLVEAGYYGFTTAWPAAYHLEHLCSWHNLPFATEENGFSGLGARLDFNGPYQARHLSNLVEWEKQGIFTYRGRFTTEPEALFKSGKCGILLQGANRYALLKGAFPIGAGFIPHYPDIDGAPHRLNIGGSSFWAISGFDETVNRGVAQFFSYLSQPEVQSYWLEKTGYLPITEAAFYLSRKRGHYKDNPAAAIAILEVMNGNATPYTKGIRLGDYTNVREVIIDAIEAALEGKCTAEEALEEACQKGNELLNQFEAQYPRAS